MIVSTNLLPTILSLFQAVQSQMMGPITMPFPYRWNPLQKSFYVSESYTSWWWIVVCVIHMLASILQAIFKYVSPEPPLLWEMVLRTCFSFLYFILATCFTAFHKFQSPAVCEFLNKLMQFDNIHVNTSQHKKWQNFETRLISLLGSSFYGNFRAINLLVAVLTAVWPKSPWNAFASIYIVVSHRISTYSYSKYIAKPTVFLVNYYFWRVIMDGAAMCYAVNFIIAIYSIKSCLQVFQHISTADVHVSEPALKIYREIQLLTNLYNDIHRNSCMIGIVVVSITGYVTFTYMLIGNYRELPSVMMITCGLITFSCNAEILLAFQLPTQVYTKSIAIYSNVSKRLLVDGVIAKKWKIMVWKSCPIIKIDFFGNYFDGTTSLVIMQFCMESTISLILLKM